MDKALNYLGLMRKAGACAVGETDCGIACREGKVRLLLLASDASEMHMPAQRALYTAERSLCWCCPTPRWSWQADWVRVLFP